MDVRVIEVAEDFPGLAQFRDYPCGAGSTADVEKEPHFP